MSPLLLLEDVVIEFLKSDLVVDALASIGLEVRVDLQKLFLEVVDLRLEVIVAFDQGVLIDIYHTSACF